MNLDVSLAGYVAPWRFAGSAALQGWLGERPWAQTPSSIVVRVSVPTDLEVFVPALEQTIRALDAGASRDLQVRQLSGAELATGLLPAALTSLGLGAPTRRYDGLQCLAQACQDAALVFVAEPLAQTPAGDLLDEAAVVTEFLGKQERPASVAILLIDTPDAALPASPCDYTAGQALVRMVPHFGGGQELLWSAYLHARLAWESAGGVTLARGWAAALDGTIRTGDDLALERRLNELACNHWRTIPPRRTSAMRDWLAGNITPAGAQAAMQCDEERTTAGLVWSPDGDRTVLPVPWAARALLCRREVPHQARPLLRHCLICRPLAEELIARCFALEARLRTTWPIDGAGVRLKAETLASYDAFQRRDPRSAAALYPSEHPDRPDSPAYFASLGEYLNVAKAVHGNLPEELFALNDLRNSLAHGHYVSWLAVLGLLQAERSLGCH